MLIKQTLADIIKESFPDKEFVFIENYDDAILGVSYSMRRLVYSMKKIIEIEMNADKEEDEEEVLARVYQSILPKINKKYANKSFNKTRPIITIDYYG
jgi:hypothetical protein